MDGSLKGIISGRGNPRLARGIVEYLIKFLKIPAEEMEVETEIRNFADGEIYVQIKKNIRGKKVFIIQPTPPPADNLMELLLLIDAAKRASAKEVCAVIPYFGYARQDRKDQPRVPISAKLVANLIMKAGADRVLTMDLHSDQIQGFFDIPVDNLFAAKIFVKEIEKLVEEGELDLNRTSFISPDLGGIKRVRWYSSHLTPQNPEGNIVFIDKRRPRPNQAAVYHVVGEVKEMGIIVDDILDTGNSLAKSSEMLAKEKVNPLFAFITHGLFSKDALHLIENSPLKKVFITNTLPPRNQNCSKIQYVSIAPLFGEAIARIFLNQSVSELYK